MKIPLGWRIECRSGTAAVLHRLSERPAGGRVVRFCQALAPAVVLGSTQPAGDIDPARARTCGLEIVRRRSGGGAVVVAPGAQIWADFFLPRSDPLFESDVSRSFLWAGMAWARALRAVLGPDAVVKVVEGAAAHMPSLARSLCFAGVVAGEVEIGGRKVLGCSQRRTRLGAWIHTMVILDGDDELLPSLLSGTDARRDEARRTLEEAMLVLPCGRERAPELSEALVASLPPSSRQTPAHRPG